jgi:hypothetical protein
MSPAGPAQPVPPGSGLVRLATSGTQAAGQGEAELVAVDPLLRRMRRMARVVKTAARLIADCNPHYRAAMVTCTYRDDLAWSPRHITQCIQACRKYTDRRGYRLRYVWVLEKTKRGRPHYHLLVWLPRREKLPMFDRRGWLPHGLTQVAWARRAVGYIAKYASKAQDAFGVKGARLYGVGGLNGAPDRDCLSWWRLSRWLRDRIPENTRADRVSFVGWVSRVSGEIIKSPWSVCWVRGILHCRRVVTA